MASFKELCEAHSANLKLLLAFMGNSSYGGVASKFDGESTIYNPRADIEDAWVTASLHGAAAVTICGFINPDNVSGTKRIVDMSISGSTGLVVNQSSAQISVNARSQAADSTQFDTNAQTMSAGTYTFFGAVCDFANDLINTYVDGTYESVSVSFGSSTANYASPSDFYIGASNGGSRFFGRIPVFAVFNKALSEAELAVIEAADSSGFAASGGGGSGGGSGLLPGANINTAFALGA